MKLYAGNGISGKTVNSANHCRSNDVSINDTSLQDDLVRRKATSYLMAVKGLLNNVNDKVYQLDHFFQLMLKQ